MQLLLNQADLKSTSRVKRVLVETKVKLTIGDGSLEGKVNGLSQINPCQDGRGWHVLESD